MWDAIWDGIELDRDEELDFELPELDELDEDGEDEELDLIIARKNGEVILDLTEEVSLDEWLTEQV